MQCPVDVTESLVAPLRFWSRYAVIPLAGLSRRYAGRWRPWGCHATNHKIVIYQLIFTIFAAKKFSNQQAINTIKKINKMFNKTIWLLTCFLRDVFIKCWLDFYKYFSQPTCREFNSLQVCFLHFFFISNTYLVTGVKVREGSRRFSGSKNNPAPGGNLAKINSAPSSSMLKINLAPTGVWKK